MSLHPPTYLRQKELAPGIIVHVLAAGSNLMQCWVSMTQGTRLPVHSHPHEQASYIVSGRVMWNIDGQGSEGVAGTAVVFAPNQAHGALVLEDCVIVDAFTPLRQDYLDDA